MSDNNPAGLQEIVKILKCILIASKDPLTVKQLQHSYRQEVGRYIPYNKFGCSNVEEFLSRHKNDFYLSHVEDVTVVSVVSLGKSEHIRSLVKRQRNRPQLDAEIKKKLNERKRLLVNFLTGRTLKDTFIFIPSSVQKKIFYFMQNKTKGVAYREFREEVLNRYTFGDFGIIQGIEEFLAAIPHLVSFYSGTIFPVRLKESGYGLSENPLFPDKWVRIIHKIFDRYPDGISIDMFSRIYKEVAGHPLDLRKFGYISTIHAILDLRNVFVIKDRMNQLLLMDARKYPYSNSCKEYLQEEIQKLKWIFEIYPEGISSKELLHVYEVTFSNSLDATKSGFPNLKKLLFHLRNLGLVHIEEKKGLIIYPVLNAGPSDEFLELPNTRDGSQVNDMVSEFQSASVTESSVDAISKAFVSPFLFLRYMPVQVLSAESPSKFFIILADEDTLKSYYQLMNELEDYYTDPEKREIFRYKPLQSGQYCIYKLHDDDFYRAKILKRVNAQEMDIYLLDLGSTLRASTENLFEMDKRFGSPQAFVLEAKLKSIEPNGISWSREACKLFMNLVNGKILMARASFYREQKENILITIELIERNEGMKVSIGDLLINKGFGKHVVKTDHPLPHKPLSEQLASIHL